MKIRKGEDTAPKDGSPFLSWDGSQWAVVKWCSCKGVAVLLEGDCKPDADSPVAWDFTHWTELPVPPK